jgi:hypothetical protein
LTTRWIEQIDKSNNSFAIYDQSETGASIRIPREPPPHAMKSLMLTRSIYPKSESIDKTKQFVE